MPGVFFTSRCGGARGVGVGVHLDRADAMFIADAPRFSTMTISRLPAWRASRRRRKYLAATVPRTRNTSGWPVPPCRRTSTTPSVIALKGSSCVR